MCQRRACHVVLSSPVSSINHCLCHPSVASSRISPSKLCSNSRRRASLMPRTCSVSWWVFRQCGPWNLCSVIEVVQRPRPHHEQGTPTLSLCKTPEGAKHLSALPLTHCAGTVTAVPSAQDAVAALYESRLGDTMLAHPRTTAQKMVR